jgi:hypothetical protein
MAQPVEKKSRHRIAWAFALGYFAFYAPYSALIKIVTEGRLTGVPAGMSGLALLPLVLTGTIVSMLLFLTLAGWWKYLQRPSPTLIASGIGTAMIIAATTVAYTFSGISIVFALLLMRAGVLIMAPLVDLASGRAVRWFCWFALGLSAIAVIVALFDVKNYALSLAAVLNLAAYLTGYIVRLPAMTSCAKVDDRHCTRRYFVTEVTVALTALAVLAIALSLFDAGAASSFRGALPLWQTAALMPVLLIGVLYTGLYIFGTLVYLDRRENTFCVALNRGTSLLAGVAAAYCIAAVFHVAPPPTMHLAAAALIIGALVMLSPAHHLFEFVQATAETVKKQADDKELRQSGP